jgi:hypothetical protein
MPHRAHARARVIATSRPRLPTHSPGWLSSCSHSIRLALLGVQCGSARMHRGHGERTPRSDGARASNVRPPHLATQRTRPDRRKGGGVLCTVQGGNPPSFRVTAARLHGHSHEVAWCTSRTPCCTVHGVRPTVRHPGTTGCSRARRPTRRRPTGRSRSSPSRCCAAPRRLGYPRGPVPARCRAWGAGAVRRVALGRLRARWSAAHARAQARRGNPSAAPRPDRMHRTHAPHGAVAADAA